MTRAVRETNCPRPADRFSPSDRGYIRSEFNLSIEIDSEATAGRSDLRHLVRFLAMSEETL